jgi:hypothetical protein
MAAMGSRARFGAAAVWAITVIAAVGSVVLLGMSWDRALTDEVFSGFGRISFLPFTVFAAACHLLMLVGVLYLARGGLAGDSRTGRVGVRCVIAGLALLFVCEWLQLPFADQHTSNTGPSIVDSVFGLATLLLAGGMIAVGVATLHQPSWGSWRQYAPLICGLLSLVVIPIQFTSVLWLGITVFCAGYLVLGVAALTEGVRRANHAIQIA